MCGMIVLIILFLCRWVRWLVVVLCVMFSCCVYFRIGSCGDFVSSWISCVLR